MKFFTVLFLSLFSFPAVSEAWHIIGGEIFYTCLGNNNYEITLKIYRDCNSSTDFDNPAAIAIYNATGLLVQTVNLPFPGATSIDPDLSNPCLQLPPGVCVEEAVYKTIINLPGVVGGYDISYQRCCRNNTIVNLFNPANTGATFTTHIPGVNTVVCNSSPRFKNYPPIVICVDEVLAFDHSATDPDGDSLVYSLCTPLQGADAMLPQPVPPPPPPYDPVIWQPPYQVSNQIGGNPSLTIDPATGMLTGYPLALGQFVVGVCVKEYRNGVFLSQDVRDFQFNITTCNPLIEANFSVAGSTSVNDTLLVCGSYAVNFENLSYGSSVFSWDFGVQGITTDVSTAANPEYIYPDTGVYKVVLKAAPGLLCGDSVFKYVEIRKGVTADFTFEDGCLMTPLVFDDASSPIDGYLSDWLWDFGDGNTDVFPDAAHPYATAGFFNVTLKVKNNYGCEASATKQVQVYPLPQINAGPDTFVCKIDTVMLHAFDGISYTWSPSTGLSDSTAQFPKVNAHTTTVYTVTVTNNYGCSGSDSVLLQVTDTVIANTGPDVAICKGESAQLSSSNAQLYQWWPDYQINNSSIADPVVMPDITTTYYVTASIGSCFDEDTVTVTVLEVPDVDAGEDITINQGETAHLQTTGNGTFLWTPPDALNNPAVADPLARPLNDITYHVLVISGNGCFASDSVKVIVTHNHFFLVPNAFTPNGDGLNDFFQFYTKGIEALLSVKVFNRWGEMVYASHGGEDAGWDGTHGGLPCEIGTYIYTVAGITYDGDVLTQKGALTLIR